MSIENLWDGEHYIVLSHFFYHTQYHSRLECFYLDEADGNK